MENEVERLFNLKSKEKLTSINNFGDFYDNKTDLCAWASAEGIDEDLLDDIIDEIDDEIGFDLEVEDLQECSASLYYNFGEGNVSAKAALYASDGVQELIEETTNIKAHIEYEVLAKEFLQKNLKDICKNNNLSMKGNKVQLLERLFEAGLQEYVLSNNKNVNVCSW